jgi:prophage antirepressor-like protein
MKNNDLISFAFDKIDIRMVKEADELETVWFVAKDIAEALGYSNPREAIIDNCKGQRHLEGIKRSSCELLLSQPQTVMIRLPDVFRLVMRSRLPSAEKFQDWVVEEVLPQIYHYGAYKYLNKRAERESRHQVALDGVRALNKMHHSERVLVARELQNDRENINKMFSEDITRDLKYFSEAELANRGNYLSLRALHDQLEYSKLTEGGYFTDLGRQFGKAGLTGSMWRLEVLDYIKDFYEERGAAILMQERRINNYH